MLSDLWKHITGDSVIVWVQSIGSKEKAVAEAAKYVSKSLSPDLYADPDALDEWICCTRGRRMALTFGRWHGVKLSEPSPNFKAEDWKCLCTLDDLIASKHNGETWAVLMFKTLQDTEPLKPRPPPLAAPRLAYTTPRNTP